MRNAEVSKISRRDLRRTLERASEEASLELGSLWSMQGTICGVFALPSKLGVF
jgi:hypothetical protein